MPVTLPEIRVGDPIRHDGLAVFPLFAEPSNSCGLRHCPTRPSAPVRLPSRRYPNPDPSPILAVENKGDHPCSVPGRRGACRGQAEPDTERQRSGGRSQQDEDSRQLCGSRSLGLQVPDQFGSGGYTLSVQAAVLPEVVGQPVAQGRTGLPVGPGRSMEGGCPPAGSPWNRVWHKRDVRHFRGPPETIGRVPERNCGTPKGLIGAAVAVGDKVVSCDLFDKPSTCEKVWNRLLSGVMLDALELGETEKQAEAADVGRLLKGLSDMPWHSADPIGEGEEHRAESPSGDHASALAFEGVVVHGSVVCQS